MPPRDLFLERTARPVIGHRGASGLRPENTLAAFALARELGAEGLEFDVRLSRDGVPVVHHDPTLDRTTSLRGPLAARTVAELARADAGGGETIPTVAAVIEASEGLPLLIEIKEPRAALPLWRVVQQMGAASRVVFASFHASALAQLRETGVPLGACRGEIARAALRAAVGWAPGPARWAFYAVPDRYKGVVPVPTARFIRRATRQGCPVHVWTVDDPDRARTLWSRGASGIITNRPDRILAARPRHLQDVVPFLPPEAAP